MTSSSSSHQTVVFHLSTQYFAISLNFERSSKVQGPHLLCITQVKHLYEIKSNGPQFRSKRIFESLKREITETFLPQYCKDALHTSSGWGTDAFIKHVTDIEISSKETKLVSLRSPPKKEFYMIALGCWFSYDDHDPRVWWCDILNYEVDRKVYFDNIYDCMLTKNESDLM